MAVYSFLTLCKFNPTAGGTTDWTYSSIVTGYQSPSSANAVNGALYIQRAESSDLSQWEVSSGAYNSGTGVFPRTTVLLNSSGTGTLQSGAGTKINFSTTPTVGAGIFISPNFNGTGQIPGTDTNDNASAGNIGEYSSATLSYASRVTMTSGVSQNITSVSLTAGDWDLTGQIKYESTGSPVTSYAQSSLSTTSGTLDSSAEDHYAYGPALNANVTDISCILPNARFSLSATTTVYLVGNAAWTGGSSPTVKAWGIITARRRR